MPEDDNMSIILSRPFVNTAGITPSGLSKHFFQRNYRAFKRGTWTFRKIQSECGMHALRVELSSASRSSFSIAMLNRWSACTMRDSDAGTKSTSIVSYPSRQCGAPGYGSNPSKIKSPRMSAV